MARNNNYYSAGEQDSKFKLIRLILCVVLALLIIVGSVCIGVHVSKLNKEHTFSGEDAVKQHYNVNILICVEDTENTDVNPQFVLLGFDGESETIAVTEIPDSLKIVGAEKTDTAKNLLNYGSARYLRDAVENHFGIDIDRYIGCSLSEVETFVEKLGGVDYNIKEQMQYKNKDGSLITNLVKGRQKLNGNQVCQFIRYDNWKSNSEKREKHEDLIVTLINEHSATLDCDKIVSVYKSISNNIDTDISIVEVNDFGLNYKVFSKAKTPAFSTGIDFSNGDTASAQITKFYK